MQTPPLLFEPLRFLTLEVQKQLAFLASYLETKQAEEAQKSLARIDYIDNDKTNLFNRCGDYLLSQVDSPQLSQEKLLTQSYQQLTQSLQDLSRQLEKVTYRALNLKAFSLIKKSKLFKALNLLQQALEKLDQAIEAEHSQQAIEICRLQLRLAKLCDKQQQNYQKRLKKGQQTEALINASLITHDIKRLGDILLRMGESILSANLGQAIKLERFHSLEATLSALELDPNSPQFSISTMGETKSGCTISGVQSSAEADQLLAIFKEGKQQKLLEEKQGIESWHEHFPGVAPEVYSYHKQGDKAALLFEYMQGKTFEKLLIEAERAPLQKAFKHLFALLQNIWQKTQQSKAYPAHFMQQLHKRLRDVYHIHPEFNLKGFQLGELKQASLETLISQAQKIEARLAVPLGVYIHGDFNLDNVIYDDDETQINFIDLHRSDYSDYVQDLSVFMISFYRLANFDPKIRQLIAESMLAVYQFGQGYAKEVNDETYHLRMALALARSFISSTRFVLDKTHAKAMHQRGRYLLEKVVALKPRHYSQFIISKELFRE